MTQFMDHREDGNSSGHPHSEGKGVQDCKQCGEYSKTWLHGGGKTEEIHHI